MGRKPRQSGYSSREKPYRSVIAKGATQHPTGNVSHHLALPPYHAHSTQPQNWEPPVQSNVHQHAEHWQVPQPEFPSPVDSLAVASYHPPSFANSATTGPTAQLEYERRTSPEANTPTNSTVTISDPDHRRRSHTLGGRATSQPEDDFPMTDDVIAGIDDRFSANETVQLIQQPGPKFIFQRNQSQSNYRRARLNNEPWDPVQSQPPPKVPSMDVDMQDVPDYAHSQEGREKGSGRTGPLSQAQRQQASDVRRMGACLRCQIMREKCDLKIPCHTCETKDRRKFPKKCIRTHFDFESHRTMYFPDELTFRLKQEKLFQHLSLSSFNISSGPEFTVKLDLNIEDKLWVVVKEFTPLQSSIRHAHRSINDGDGNKTYKRLEIWDPPIIMRVRDGELQTIISSMRQKMTSLFTNVLSEEAKWTNWSMKYFFHVEEDFQCSLVIWIGKYYRKEIEEHSILSTALSLLWWEYLLLNKFTIAQDDLPNLEARLKARRPEGGEHLAAIPDTINRFLKAIILPMAIETAKKLTETLHERLFRMAVTQKLSQSGTDITMCLMFVLVIFMGGIQSTLLLLPDIPGEESEVEYNLDKAKAKILEIEESIIELWTSFHRYTLSRRGSGTTSKSTLSAKEVNSKAEIHARNFGLIGKMKKEIEDDYGTCLPPAFDVASVLLSCQPGRRQRQMQRSLLLEQQTIYRVEADWFALSVNDRPTDLNVGANHGYELDGFRAANITRLCWKVWANVESGAA